MEISLKRVPYEQKHILWNLLELYCYDFSEYLKSDVNESGRFGYRYLDHYWTETGRFPFLIYCDAKIAGFVLINQHILLSKNRGGFALSEFFILRRYRRIGVGQAAAFAAFDRFPGKWELSIIQKNVPAAHFWRAVIKKYTKGNFQEKEDANTSKVILYFEEPQRGKSQE